MCISMLSAYESPPGGRMSMVVSDDIPFKTIPSTGMPTYQFNSITKALSINT